MTSFSEQLASTRANLERLSKLAQEAPDLFAGHYAGIYVQDYMVRVHLGNAIDPDWSWRSLALKYRRANWQRDGDGHWDGELDGVKITLLNAEQPMTKQPLFAEVPA